MKKILIVAMLCMALVATMAPAAAAADTNYAQCMAAIQEQKTIQAQAHKTATTLRKKGYKDSSAYVQAAKDAGCDRVVGEVKTQLEKYVSQYGY